MDARELEASLGVLEPAVLEGLRLAVDNVRAVARAQLREPVVVDLPQGQGVEIAEVPVRRVGVYAPGGRAAYPVDRDHVRGDRACCWCRGGGGVRPARARGARSSRRAGRVRAVRGGRGLPDGRRPGHRRAGLRDRVGARGRRGGGAGQRLRARGQAPGGRRGGHRQPGRAERAGRGGHRRRGSRADRARPDGPGRARRGLGADAGLAGRVAARRRGGALRRLRSPAARCWPPRTRARPCGWPTRWRPSTCS